MAILGQFQLSSAIEPAVARRQPEANPTSRVTTALPKKNELVTGFDRARSPLTRSDLMLSSAASCAATACHGGSRAGIAVASASRGSEYPLWIESDPHAQSWRTICSDASLKMMERLKIFAGGEIIDQVAFDNCLACHNSTRQTNEPRSSELLREGVGCSGCHGPDQLWRGNHFSFDSNRSYSLANGFAQTKNMLSRARICATCHVGDKDRDMNHDIIAAGHPALHYEFASFHQKQPKHWRESSITREERFEAGQWIAGQFAALDASMVLLETRAGRSHSISQWPELASFDCASCHQSLRVPGTSTHSSAQSSQSEPQRNGNSSTTLSQWNRFGVQELLRLRESEGRATAVDRELIHQLQQLATLLRTLSADPDKVQLSATGVRQAIDGWLKSPEGLTEVRDFNSRRLLQIVQSAASIESNQKHWESMAQLYLASMAGRAAWPGSPSQSRQYDSRSPVIESATKLRQSLLFPPNSSSAPRYLPEASTNLRQHASLLLPMQHTQNALPSPNLLK